jgi:hypothetical protein
MRQRLRERRQTAALEKKVSRVSTRDGHLLTADDEVATKGAEQGLKPRSQRVRFSDEVDEAPFPIGRVGPFPRANARFWVPLVDCLLGGWGGAGVLP